VGFLSDEAMEQDGAPGLYQALRLAHGPSVHRTTLQLVWRELHIQNTYSVGTGSSKPIVWLSRFAPTVLLM